jgi:hypothetical protein
MVSNKKNISIIILILIVFCYVYFTKSNYQLIRPGIQSETFEIPAPATVMKTPLPIQVPREVSPSGPNPPNARIPDSIARLNSVFIVTPNDPMDEQYGSQDIQDNLRYPERSFRPGLINSGNKIITNSEVASNRMLDTAQPLQPFKPELVENGGLLDGIGADDTHTNYNYASF